MADIIMKSFNLQGIQDFVDDYLDQVVPEDAPFSGKLEKVSTNTPTFSWVQDKNDALTRATPNGVEEGQQSGFFAQTYNEQLEVENYTQIFSREVIISDTAAATKVHGRTGKSELQYQIEKAIQAINVDIEKVFLSDQVKVKPAPGVAPLTDGAQTQIPAALHVNLDITAPNIKTLTDALFQYGSEADMIICSPEVVDILNQLMNTGTGVGKRMQIQEFVACPDGTKALVEKNSFTDINGKLYCVCPSRHLKTGTAIFLNRGDFAKVVFRDITVSELGKWGSSVKYLVECQVGLRHQHRWKAGVIVKP